jgi:hypothetical protein
MFIYPHWVRKVDPKSTHARRGKMARSSAWIAASVASPHRVSQASCSSHSTISSSNSCLVKASQLVSGRSPPLAVRMVNSHRLVDPIQSLMQSSFPHSLPLQHSTQSARYRKTLRHKSSQHKHPTARRRTRGGRGAHSHRLLSTELRQQPQTPSKEVVRLERRKGERRKQRKGASETSVFGCQTNARDAIHGYSVARRQGIRHGRAHGHNESQWGHESRLASVNRRRCSGTTH